MISRRRLTEHRVDCADSLCFTGPADLLFAKDKQLFDSYAGPSVSRFTCREQLPPSPRSFEYLQVPTEQMSTLFRDQQLGNDGPGKE